MRSIKHVIHLACWLAWVPAFAGMTAFPAHAAKSTVFIEDMTWMEIKDRIKDGATIVIVPTGGTEQNGPHMVTGKHNYIVRYTTAEIAKKLGNALVAPVLAYVPEGRIDPPEGHMQFPGTLSVSDKTFGAVLEETAQSLKQHGFKLICFVGDSGGNQSAQKEVAAKLTSEWRDSGVRVLHVSDYYSNNGQEKWNQSIGLKVPTPDAHAGHEDTSELMAIDSSGIRDSLRAVHTQQDYKTSGAMGDSSMASAAAGKKYLSLKVEAAVRQIKNAEGSR